MGCGCNHNHDHDHKHSCGCHKHEHKCGSEANKCGCNGGPKQDICMSDTDVCLTRKRLLSEFKTDIEKSEARKNLGITDDYIKELINKNFVDAKAEVLFDVAISSDMPEDTDNLWFDSLTKELYEYKLDDWYNIDIPSSEMLFVTPDNKIYKYIDGNVELLINNDNFTTSEYVDGNFVKKIESSDEWINVIRKSSSDNIEYTLGLSNSFKEKINGISNGIESLGSGIDDLSGRIKPIIIEGGNNVSVTPSETDTEKKFVIDIEPVNIPNIVSIPNHNNDTLIKELDNGDIGIGCKSIISSNGSIIINHNYKENEDDEFEKIDIMVYEPSPVAYARNLDEFINGIKYLNERNGGTLRIIGSIKLNKLFDSTNSSTISKYTDYGIELINDDYCINFKNKINNIIIEGWSSNATLCIATVRTPTNYTNCIIKAEKLYLKNLSVSFDEDEYNNTTTHFCIMDKYGQVGAFCKNTKPLFSVLNYINLDNCIIRSQNLLKSEHEESDFINSSYDYSKEGILFEASGNTFSGSTVNSLIANISNCSFKPIGYYAGDVACTNQNYLKILYKPEAGSDRRLGPSITTTTSRIYQSNYQKDYKIYIDCDSRISSASKVVDLSVCSDNMEVIVNKPENDNNFNYIIMK